MATSGVNRVVMGLGPIVPRTTDRRRARQRKSTAKERISLLNLSPTPDDIPSTLIEKTFSDQTYFDFLFTHFLPDNDPRPKPHLPRAHPGTHKRSVRNSVFGDGGMLS